MPPKSKPDAKDAPKTSGVKTTAILHAELKATYAALEQKYFTDDNFFKTKLDPEVHQEFLAFIQKVNGLAPSNSGAVPALTSGIKILFKNHSKLVPVTYYGVEHKIPRELFGTIPPETAATWLKDRYTQFLGAFLTLIMGQFSDAEISTKMVLVPQYLPILTDMRDVLRVKFSKEDIFSQDPFVCWTIKEPITQADDRGHYAQLQEELSEEQVKAYITVLAASPKKYQAQRIACSGTNKFLLIVPRLDLYRKEAENKVGKPNPVKKFGAAGELPEEDVIGHPLRILTGTKWTWAPDKLGFKIIRDKESPDLKKLEAYFKKHLPSKVSKNTHRHKPKKVELWLNNLTSDDLVNLPSLDSMPPDAKSAEAKASTSSNADKVTVLFQGKDPKKLWIGDRPPKLGEVQPVDLAKALPKLGLESWDECLKIEEESIPVIQSQQTVYGRSITPGELRELYLRACDTRDLKVAFCKLGGDRYEVFCRLGNGKIKKGEPIVIDLCLLSTQNIPERIRHPIYRPGTKEVIGYRYSRNLVDCMSAGIESKQTISEEGEPNYIALEDYSGDEQAKARVVTSNVETELLDFCRQPVVVYIAARDIEPGEVLRVSAFREAVFAQNFVPHACDAEGNILEEVNLPVDIELRFTTNPGGFYPRVLNRAEVQRKIQQGIPFAQEYSDEYDLLYFPDDIQQAFKESPRSWWIEPKPCWRNYKAYSVNPNTIEVINITPDKTGVRIQFVSKGFLKQPTSREAPQPVRPGLVAPPKQPDSKEVKGDVRDTNNCVFEWRYQLSTQRLWCFTKARKDVIIRGKFLFSNGLAVEPEQPGLTIDQMPMVLIDEAVTEEVLRKLASHLPRAEWDAICKILPADMQETARGFSAVLELRPWLPLLRARMQTTIAPPNGVAPTVVGSSGSVAPADPAVNGSGGAVLPGLQDLQRVRANMSAYPVVARGPVPAGTDAAPQNRS